MPDLRVIVHLSGGPCDGHRYDSMAMHDADGISVGESRNLAIGVYATTRGKVGRVFLQTAPLIWQNVEQHGHEVFKGRPYQQHEYRIVSRDEVDNVVTIRAEHVGLHVEPKQE